MYHHLVMMFLRLAYHRILLSINYIWLIKNNPSVKFSTQQLARENNSYVWPIFSNAMVLIGLECLFPNMFINDNPILQCFFYSIMTHALIVEPIYWISHRLFHTRLLYSTMHKYHHLSVDTMPTTGICQHPFEHLLYNIIMAPAIIVPYFLFNSQHVISSLLYMFIFDLVNAWGHTTINVPEWYTNSFLKYLFYPPSFHHKHHTGYKMNYALYMPIYDKLFGTYSEPHPNTFDTTCIKGQDMVLLCHMSGVYHIMNVPEINYCLVYTKPYLFISPTVDLLLTKIIGRFMKLFSRYYMTNCYRIGNAIVCRTLVIYRSPFEYMNPSSFPMINKELIDAIHNEYYYNGTTKFGLTNLNKNKQLNNSGEDLIKYIPKDVLLWTGDSMSSAAVYNYLIQHNINDIFFIGGTGKIGKVVCKMLAKHNVRITLYSENKARANEIASYNPNYISVTDKLSDIHNYQNIVVGKYIDMNKLKLQDKNILDYNVPFIKCSGNNHVQLGVLRDTKRTLTGLHECLTGCNEDETYACFAGCFINGIINRTTHEVGEINEHDVVSVWAHGQALGFQL